MPKKKVTKIDPREELSPYLNHQQTKNKNSKSKKKLKVSASLSNLKLERHRSLIKNLGILVGGSAFIVLCLAYYVSPLANVGSVEVNGASDLPIRELVTKSGIRACDKVLDYKFNPVGLNKKLVGSYPEVKAVKVHVHHLNQLIIDVEEHSTIAYIKEKSGYRKILNDGKIGSQLLKWSQVDQEKPLFIGYNQKTSLKTDLKLFNSLPSDFRKEVKLLSGSARRKSQIVLVMKDGNVVIGDIATLKQKIKYYNTIRDKAGKNSLIDLEIGAFSRPLTKREMKAYGIS